MTMPDLESLAALVREIARRELLPRFCSVDCAWKADGSALTEADLACDAALREALARRWPDIRLLSEEMPEAERRALLEDPESAFWVVDPLDGTNNFAHGIPFFCVSVALVVGGHIRLGVVFDPIRDECYTAERDQGAWLNGRPVTPASPAPPLDKALILCNPDRLSPEMRHRLLDPAPPYGSMRNFGALALEWCWTAQGRGHLYFHARQNLWDYAAGWLVLTESGGLARTFEGDPIPEHSDRPCSAIASRNRDLFAALLEHVRVEGG